jgi:hypothetical protein
MPRNISADSIEKIAQRTGVEPISIIRIQWVVGGEYHYYADRYIPEADIEGKLIEMGDLEAVLNIDKSGTSTSVNIILSDTNGVIKTIFNDHDIHGRPVAIYQWFSDIPFSEKFIIFEGVIASPIIWKEGERVISFDVITKLEDREVGFSIEDGDFANIPDIILGKTWPLVFGIVYDMPTIQMDDIPTGTTLIPIGIPDPNIDRQINYLDSSSNDQAGKATCLSLRGAEMQFLGESRGDRAVFERGQALQRQAQGMFTNVNKINRQSDRLKTIRNDQNGYDISAIPIVNGHLFQQGISTEIEINNIHYLGQFQGDNFIVSARRGPNENVHREPRGKQVKTFEAIIADTQEEADFRLASLIFDQSFDLSFDATNQQEMQAYWACEPPYFQTFPFGPAITNPADTVAPHHERTFDFVNAGASVTISGSYPIRYVVSVVPGVQVLWVSARRTVGGFKIITPVPPDYYFVSQVVYGSIVATIVTFFQPLSTVKGQDWENELFATVQSPIGPNVVDIIIWLIQTYTDYGIDFNSFNHVRILVANYPANFAILDKRNVVDLLKDIAWQSRCAIWIADGLFYLKYLPEQGTVVDNLTEDDIKAQTLEVTTTSTEDLVTKFIATYKSTYSQDKPNKLILRYNINKYGTHERTFDFFIYNSAELVVKSATFWLIRMANVWKMINCKAFLTKLKLETLDNVSVEFAKNYVSVGNVIGNIEKVTFSTSDYKIDMSIWLPIRLGEMEAYPFAYPADISTELIFPTDRDIAGGFISDTAVNDAAIGDVGVGNSNRIVQSFQRPPSKTNRVQPSDHADTPEHNNIPPIITTTAPYNNSAVPGGQGGARVTPPGYDYRFDSANPRNVIPEVPQFVELPITPGFITDKINANLYSAVIFPNGINAPGVNINNVIIPQIDPEDIIANPTWGLISKLTRKQGDDVITEFYFQPPIWVIKT